MRDLMRAQPGGFHRRTSHRSTSNPHQIFHYDSQHGGAGNTAEEEQERREEEEKTGGDEREDSSRRHNRQPLNMSRTPWMTLDSFSSLVQPLTKGL